jgi:hypothetical protein
MNDERHIISITDVTSDGAIKISLGKKKHVLVKPE